MMSKLGKLIKAEMMKNSFQPKNSATTPLVEEKISREAPITDDKSAYCVAVYDLLHSEEIYATKAVVAMPEIKFSTETTAINSSILCP